MFNLNFITLYIGEFLGVYNLICGEDSPFNTLGNPIRVSPKGSLGVLSTYKVIPSLSIPYGLLGIE